MRAAVRITFALDGALERQVENVFPGFGGSLIFRFLGFFA